ncbi:MAG TPA: hypothetical protein PKC39_13365 [Ferruginibacter sp.]|nr:hypothetical protein [Ferruginibacter sp.]HMP21943.1 hypothetical protein [Ferruginibacter sp.]
MKMRLFTLALILFTANGFAQSGNDVKFTFGPELGFATGSFGNSHSIGIGGTVQLEIPVKERTQATIMSGIILYNGKSVRPGEKKKGRNIIPLRAGVKQFLVGGVYGGLQLGVGFLNQGGGTAFSYAPQVGYEFFTKNGKGIDLSGRYDVYSKNGSIGAFVFRLGFTL